MTLAVDIGNSNITLALMDERRRIVKTYLVPTAKPFLGKIAARIKKRHKVDTVIMVSVVPRVLGKVRADAKKLFSSATIYVVGEDIKVPLKCEYNRKEIGQDRLVTALAAKSLYGLPILIIDFGTAVTFDAVSSKGVYLGGLILPGIKMSLESLSERTAMLPKTFLKETRSFIGRNTASSIRSGMIYGYASLCDGLISLFRKKVNRRIKVVATGGDAPLIRKHINSSLTIDQSLSLKGLSILIRLNLSG